MLKWFITPTGKTELQPVTDLQAERRKFIDRGISFTISIVGSDYLLSALDHKPYLLVRSLIGIACVITLLIFSWCVEHLTKGPGSAERRQRLWNAIAITFVASCVTTLALGAILPRPHQTIAFNLAMSACANVVLLLAAWGYFLYRRRRAERQS